MKHRTLKQIMALILCAATVISFAACSKEKEKKNETANGDKNAYATSWVVKPSIIAQAIDPLTRADFNETTNHYDISYADCFRIMQNGKYGIIDLNGKIVVPAEYEDLYAIRESLNFLGIKLDYNSERVQTYIHYGTFETEPAYRKYNSEKYEYYWNTSSNKAVFVENKNGDAKEQEFSPSLPETVKGVVYEGNRFVATGSYGLYFNSKNVTGMRYTGAGCFADGKAAFKSNGKWGYIDNTGRTVIPFEYDAVWGYNALGGEDTPYESYNGYVTLCKDKKFGVMKDDGTIVVPFIYDGATPVVNGMLFVKTDGKWGVLSVDGSAEPVDVTSSTEGTTESTTEESTQSTTESTTAETTSATSETTENDEEETTKSSSYSTGIYVLSDPLNVRSEASADSEIVEYADEGASVYIDRVEGTWGHTVYEGKEGWINLKYIRAED